MEKQLFQDMHPAERLQMLKDNCDKIEPQSYMKRFTPEEIVMMKDNLAEVSIEINDITTEKKAKVKEFTEKEKPLITQKKGLLTNIKRKAIEVYEDCYKFIDQDTNTVAYYNALGDQVFSRPINPEEKQKTIFSIKAGTGTND